MVESSTFEKLENKKKMIVIIKDFIRFPSVDPTFRYETICHQLQTLLEEKKLSKSHYTFLARALEVEYTICLSDLRDMDETEMGYYG